jgi:hypothetical protein
MKQLGFVLFIIMAVGIIFMGDIRTYNRAFADNAALSSQKTPALWPPQTGKPYPELALINHREIWRACRILKGRWLSWNLSA